MHLPATGEIAAQLPWLWPDARSLTVLAEPLSPATWQTLRRDPAALLLIQRLRSFRAASVESEANRPARFLEPRILETVVNWFEHDRGCWIDWRQPAVLPIYQTALAIAHHARIIANLTRCCDPVAAWTAGMLSPLGWFATAAADPSQIAACLVDPEYFVDPESTQIRHWGYDQSSIARRLARRWQLPDWLRLLVGHLDLSVETAEPLGSETRLFATVKLAILLADRAGYSLGLASRLEEGTLLASLKMETADLLVVSDRFRHVDFNEAFEPEWQDPRSVSGLPSLLKSAVKQRRAEASPFLEPLERDLDRMHRLLVRMRSNEAERLQTSKLAALAEFAAGASHEINNPLAVISGQSQYLLHRPVDDRQRSALESIVRQTQRIHSILAELMQFARPPQVRLERIAVADVVKAAVFQFQGLAGEMGVALDSAQAGIPISIDGDPKMLQTAIGCVVRNAIEAAAPGKGWVRVGIELTGGRVEIRVEDNGPGLTLEQQEHMFDPFYSGRPAGRGRGFGLPTAWRLTRELGGDVRYVPQNGPTCFTLSLPLPVSSGRDIERLSA